MKWNGVARGKPYSESEDGEISYDIRDKRNGKFYIEASLAGGAEHRLPYQDFPTAEAAMAWVEEYEAKRQASFLHIADEKPIQF